MDYKKLRLSWRERLILRLSRRHQIPVRFCGRLLRHGLVKELRYQPSPGSMPVGTGYAIITPDGEDYLCYARSDGARFWFPVLISLFSLLVSIISLIVSISP